MKFSAQQADMAGALAKVVPLAKTKTTVAMLSNVRLEATRDGITVRTTNLEIDMEAKCAATVERPGITCVNAAQLAGIIAALPKAALGVELDMGVVHITAGRSAFKLVSAPHFEFPEPPARLAANHAIDPADVKWLLDGVAHSVSDAETRPNLCGVFSSSDGKTLTFVSSDGHRLSLRATDWVGPEFEGIVPARAWESIAAMKTVRLAMDAHRLVAESNEGDAMSSRLIDGRFPDYRAVMPKSHKGSLVVDREALLAAIKRVGLMALDAAKTMRFRLGDGEWLIEAVTPQSGEARERIDVEAEGEVVDLGMNAGYLSQALAAVDGDKVALRTGDNQSPILVVPVGTDTTQHVIMPIRV